jgi:hypothetical protein
MEIGINQHIAHTALHCDKHQMTQIHEREESLGLSQADRGRTEDPAFQKKKRMWF